MVWITGRGHALHHIVHCHSVHTIIIPVVMLTMIKWVSSVIPMINVSTYINLIYYLLISIIGNECTNGDIRLVNGTNSGSGRVEYCFEGGWSPLCWISSVVATTICQTVGHNTTCELIFISYVHIVNYLQMPLSIMMNGLVLVMF